jgi:hypothetical protein
MSNDETIPVQINVAGVEFCDGCGSLKAVAVVEMSVGGFDFTLQGVQIRVKDGRYCVQAPMFRDPRSGVWRPCLLMPPELRTAMAVEVLAAVDEGLWDRRLVPTYTEASER